MKKNFFYHFWKAAMTPPHWGSVLFVNVVRKPRVAFIGEKYRIKGGAILCANHTCYDDPVVMHATVWNRRLFFLTAEVALRNTWRKVLLGGSGCMKIDRNISDINAMRDVVDVLKFGNAVGIFPQGKVYRDQSMDSIKSGAILIALQADVPIYPMYLGPYEGFFAHRAVVFGEPLNCKEFCTKKYPSMKDINALTDELFSRMNVCKAYYEENMLTKQEK